VTESAAGRCGISQDYFVYDRLLACYCRLSVCTLFQTVCLSVMLCIWLNDAAKRNTILQLLTPTPSYHRRIFSNCPLFEPESLLPSGEYIKTH